MLVDLAVLAVLALLAVLSVAGVGQRAGDGSRSVAEAVIGHEMTQVGGIHRLQRSDRCRDQIGFGVTGDITVMPGRACSGDCQAKPRMPRPIYQLNPKG